MPIASRFIVPPILYCRTKSGEVMRCTVNKEWPGGTFDLTVIAQWDWHKREFLPYTLGFGYQRKADAVWVLADMALNDIKHATVAGLRKARDAKN